MSSCGQASFVDSCSADALQSPYFIVYKDMYRYLSALDLSADSIILYSLLRDRCSLSLKNHRIDGEGRIFIYYPRSEASDVLGWSPDKTRKEFQRLLRAGLLTETPDPGNKNRNVRRLYVRQWVTPGSIYPDKLLSLSDILAGGLPYLTPELIGFGFGSWYRFPVLLLSQYQELSLLAKQIYVIALDSIAMSLHASFQSRTNEGHLCCHLDPSELSSLLGCSVRSVKYAFSDLTAAGLMDRRVTSFGGVAETVLRDLSDVRQKCKNQHTQVQELAYACAENSAPQVQKIAPIYPSSPIQNHSSLLFQPNLRGHAQDAAEKKDAVAWLSADFLEPMLLSRLPGASLYATAKEALSIAIGYIRDDFQRPNRLLRIGSATVPVSEVLAQYRAMTPDILLQMVIDTAMRAEKITSMEAYIRRALISVYDDHLHSRMISAAPETDLFRCADDGESAKDRIKGKSVFSA